ncbi:MAG: hypothetical protein ABI323_10425 [Solirubrobacteraceae bacterium]
MLGTLNDSGQQLACAVRAIVGDDGVERLQPLGGLDGVEVGGGAVAAGRLNSIRHAESCPSSSSGRGTDYSSVPAITLSALR